MIGKRKRVFERIHCIRLIQLTKLQPPEVFDIILERPDDKRAVIPIMRLRTDMQQCILPKPQNKHDRENKDKN